MSDKFKTSDKLKFDKLVEGGDIFLKCLIPSEGVNGVPVSSANNNQVSSLVDAIRNRHLDLFKDIDSSRLKLYKNKEIADSVIILNLKNDNVAILDGTELMNPENTIHSYFNDQPKPLYPGERGSILSYTLLQIIKKHLFVSCNSDIFAIFYVLYYCSGN